jgi:hypothetical protein
LELFQQCCIFLLDVGTVPTVLYFSIGFWSCSNSVVFFYWILELFQQCCIFLLDVGTFPTVLYFSIGFWSCSNSVVFFYWMLELFQQCCIFLLDFGAVPTVLYFSIGFWNCSNSVVFFYWILELFQQCGIFLLDFGTVQTVWYFSFLFIIDCSLEALTFLLFIKMICTCTFYYLLTCLKYIPFSVIFVFIDEAYDWVYNTMQLSNINMWHWLITGFVTRLTRRVLLVEQELVALSGHLRHPSSPPSVFSCVGFTRLVLLDL